MKTFLPLNKPTKNCKQYPFIAHRNKIFINANQSTTFNLFKHSSQGPNHVITKCYCKDRKKKNYRKCKKKKKNIQKLNSEYKSLRSCDYHQEASVHYFKLHSSQGFWKTRKSNQINMEQSPDYISRIELNIGKAEEEDGTVGGCSRKMSRKRWWRRIETVWKIGIYIIGLAPFLPASVWVTL